MLYVREDGRLAAKLADLGTAVQLPSADALIAEPMGTTGCAGKRPLQHPHVYLWRNLF
jgi:hypothetical protein